MRIKQVFQKTVLCLYLIVFACIHAYAHNDNVEAERDSITDMDVVTVVAQKAQQVISGQTLKGERLEGLSSLSVADAIRYFSGVQVKDYGGVGGLKTVDIRSMGTNHMGVFYDGIQLGNAQNGQIDLGKYSLDNIEEISLFNGQKSQIFQPAKDYGSSGTVYLTSRKPRFAKGKDDNVRVLMRGGSFGLLNPSVLWEHRFSDALHLSASAEYTHATGKYKFRYRKVFSDGTVAWDTTATRENGDIEALRIEGSLSGYLPRRGQLHDGKWNTKLYYYNSQRGIPGAIVNNVWKRSQRQWDRNFFVQSHYQEALGERYEWMLNMKYANDYMRYLNPDTTLLLIDNTFRQQEAYVSTSHLLHLVNKKSGASTLQWDLSASADYQWNYLDATLQDFVNPRRNTYLVALATMVEWNWVHFLASVLSTTVDERVQRTQSAPSEAPLAESGTPDNYQAFTPAFFLTLRPLTGCKDFSIRAFYKRIFRMPTFNDLYYTDIGNVHLRPEYTNQLNLGMQYQTTWKRMYGLKSVDFKVDVYKNEVEDKIIAVPKGSGQYRWMMMNIGYCEIKGLDLTADMQWQWRNGWSTGLHGTYTYQKAQDFTDPEDNDEYGGTWGGQISYIPWHSASGTCNVGWRSWRLNYSVIYVGERYHTSANIRANYEQPWYTHDLSLHKDFRLNGWGTLGLTMEVNNVFDQQYDVVLNYPMPGRNYRGTVKWEF